MVTPLLAFAPLAFFGWFMVRTLCRPEVPKLIHQPRPKPWLLLVGHLGLSPLFSMKWSSIWEYEQYVHVISLYVPTNLHSRTLCFSLLHHDKSARRSVKPHIFGYTKTIFSHEQCSKCLCHSIESWLVKNHIFLWDYWVYIGYNIHNIQYSGMLGIL